MSLGRGNKSQRHQQQQTGKSRGNLSKTNKVIPANADPEIRDAMEECLQMLKRRRAQILKRIYRESLVVTRESIPVALERQVFQSTLLGDSLWSLPTPPSAEKDIVMFSASAFEHIAKSMGAEDIYDVLVSSRVSPLLASSIPKSVQTTLDALNQPSSPSAAGNGRRKKSPSISALSDAKLPPSFSAAAKQKDKPSTTLSKSIGDIVLHLKGQMVAAGHGQRATSSGDNDLPPNAYVYWALTRRTDGNFVANADVGAQLFIDEREPRMQPRSIARRAFNGLLQHNKAVRYIAIYSVRTGRMLAFGVSSSDVDAKGFIGNESCISSLKCGITAEMSLALALETTLVSKAAPPAK